MELQIHSSLSRIEESEAEKDMELWSRRSHGNMNKGIEEKSRSFRGEDYSNRRLFLRSYPLRLEEERKEAAAQKISLKSRIKAALQWGEGAVLRLRSRVTFRLVAGHPYGGKPTKMLTV